MTKEEFDNYRFSVCTEISYRKGVWYKVVEVQFTNRRVWANAKYIYHTDIKGIREAQDA